MGKLDCCFFLLADQINPLMLVLFRVCVVVSFKRVWALLGIVKGLQILVSILLVLLCAVISILFWFRVSIFIDFVFTLNPLLWLRVFHPAISDLDRKTVRVVFESWSRKTWRLAHHFSFFRHLALSEPHFGTTLEGKAWIRLQSGVFMTSYVGLDINVLNRRGIFADIAFRSCLPWCLFKPYIWQDFLDSRLTSTRSLILYLRAGSKLRRFL